MLWTQQLDMMRGHMLLLVSKLLASADPLFNYRLLAQRCCLFITNIDCSDGFAVITKSLIDQLQPFIAHQAKA